MTDHADYNLLETGDASSQIDDSPWKNHHQLWNFVLMGGNPHLLPAVPLKGNSPATNWLAKKSSHFFSLSFVY